MGARFAATVSEGRSPGSGLLLAATVALPYFLAAQFVLWLNNPAQAGTNFWPAAGLSIAALLLVPTRRWPWALLGVLLAEVGSDFVEGYSPAITGFLALGNIIEPVVGATLIRWSGSARGELVPIRPLTRFLCFGVVVAPLIGAAIGTVGTALSGGDFLASWPKFVVGDALGILVVAPLFLAFREDSGRHTWHESVLLTLGTVTVSFLALRHWSGGWDTITPYFVIPFLTWTAVRYGIRGASWAVLVMALIANLAVATDTAPFAATIQTGYSITLLQVYLAIVASTTFILAAAVNELGEQRGIEAVLRHQAFHDALTGLPNRAYLEGKLQRQQASRGTTQARIALLMLDLDRFKAVNDSFGHPAGDAVLVIAAHRLMDSVRSTDLVVRFGGDEFMVLLGGTEERTLEQVVARILATLSAPMHVLGQDLELTASIGVVTADIGAAPASLLTDVDMALYRAKALGGNQAVGSPGTELEFAL